ncbi:hypothetical protein RUESEDTHA_03669 [Ruegeria sp. THAF57]|uniref:hypothetical protein n=1 Tax=Ruegeria sp. THAF57 TaxID=2744555 RepID=UPI0015DFA39D|nr:hypothetical protein [Ruegeria sp. THAF57]CAD0186758.1 hypothetical protein RUESEDTHA_03669 [Ruegeria sp. THAF57]
MTGPNSEDDEPQDLLVFLANDTLEGEERRVLEQAVAANPELRAELAALTAARIQMQGTEVETSPGEFGLARLMRDANANRSVTQPKATKPGLWKIAAIAAMALLAVQATLPYLNTGPDVELADGGPESLDTGPTLTVAFAATATEKEIRALLLELDLTIVSGPSALGLYTLAAKDEGAAARALDRLNAATGIVESVEVEGGD